jgi:hypothetical protein
MAPMLIEPSFQNIQNTYSTIMDHLPFTKRYHTQLKTILLSFAFLSFIALNSCTNVGGSTEKKLLAEQGDTIPQIMTPKLHDLYLPIVMYKNMRANTENDYKKVVFTFVLPAYLKDGSPSLSATSAKNNHKEFGQDPQLLNYGKVSQANLQLPIFFSSLWIKSETLNNAINNNNCTKCAFYLEAQSDPHLQYKVYFVNDSNEILAPNINKLNLTFLDDANPSPPKNSL